MKQKVALFICLQFMVFNVFGQVADILEQFSARQIGHEIRVDAGIKGGASCVGIALERSIGGADFEVVDEIGGVCGGSEFTEYYVLIDTNPKAYCQNSYRLRLGASGLTQTKEILFVPPTDGLVVYPNPAKADITLIWSDILSDATIDIFQIDGKLRATYQNISGTEVRLNLTTLPTGLYILQLRTQNTVFARERIVVGD